MTTTIKTSINQPFRMTCPNYAPVGFLLSYSIPKNVQVMSEVYYPPKDQPVTVGDTLKIELTCCCTQTGNYVITLNHTKPNQPPLVYTFPVECI